jgi:hypothetical protein
METSVIRPEHRGSYMSIRSAVQQLTSGLAAFIAGQIILEKPSTFSTEAKALVNYEYVGLIAVAFSLISLWIGRQLTVERMPDFPSTLLLKHIPSSPLLY